MSIPMEISASTIFLSKHKSSRIHSNSSVFCVANKWRKPFVGMSMNSTTTAAEVIGIGSRNDALLDFCLDFPLSSSLRFWDVVVKDSLDAQLRQRFLAKDLNPRVVEVSHFLQSSSKAIILVASAGYGYDHVAVIDLLKTARSSDAYVIAVILKPFSFEGKRRLDEIEDLLVKIQKHTDFCIDIETNRLLEKDFVTLDEALKTANTAVFMAINAISVLVSDIHTKFIDVAHSNLKELKATEVMEILQNHKKAKVGFGAGSDFKTSILQAIHDCPFIGTPVKDLDGVIMCILSSSNPINNNDLLEFVHIFRQSTDYTREIMISIILDPILEPDLFITTVVTLGSLKQQNTQDSSILSRLAHHFPFVFDLLRRNYPREACIPDSREPEDTIAAERVAEGFDDYSEEVQSVSSSYDTSNSDQSFDGTAALQREPLSSWNVGPGHHIAEEWAKERAADAGASPVLDNLSIFSLPVGVRSSEQSTDWSSGVSNLNLSQQQELRSEDDVDTNPTVNSNMSSLSAISGAYFDVVREFYSSASTLLKGKTVDNQKKQGVLSVRAASMLEAERDSPKRWTPVVEMQYRGGVYIGQCLGGLPEGKGRLILRDGSIYNGMWRYGKRSGLGTYYFSNGDVFQGSWRDDVMHGKGWFYFHTGDRWFANFWKGKANGEGRFYSKSGDVIFGDFQDGWRHGRFLCINVRGERCIEIWDEGVCLSRKPFESDAE